MAASEPQLGIEFHVVGKADGFLGHRIKKEDFDRKPTRGESTVLKMNRMIKNTQPFGLQNKDSLITRPLTITLC